MGRILAIGSTLAPAGSAAGFLATTGAGVVGFFFWPAVILYYLPL